MKKVQNIYDNASFYNEYRKMREGKVNANELIEIPIMKTLLPNIEGKKILDLGCGNGSMSKYFIENGAKYVLALDISQNMINEAKEKNNNPKITYNVLGMEEISLIKEKFDIVFSSLAFHYIKDFSKLTNNINELLNENGILLFSQEHPTVTAPVLNLGMKNRIEINDNRYYLLNNYNENGKREFLWNDCAVVKYHRNFECLINTLINNKFNILKIKESTASQEAIEKIEKYKFQKDRPFFLFIKAQKNN